MIIDIHLDAPIEVEIPVRDIEVILSDDIVIIWIVDDTELTVCGID